MAATALNNDAARTQCAKAKEAQEAPSARNSLTDRIRHSLRSKIDYANMPPLLKIPLWELNCSFDMVQKKHWRTTLLKDAVRRQRRAIRGDVTIVFAIRQAGCASCREHAKQLAELACRDPKLALMATVKETGVNDLGLLEFYQNFFQRNPIYLDEDWKLYKAMGSRRVNPLKFFLRLVASQPSYFRQKVWHSIMNFKVLKSPWMLGGVLVFNKRQELVFALEESFGKPFDMERLQLAIEEARRQNAFPGNGIGMDESEMSTSITMQDNSCSDHMFLRRTPASPGMGDSKYQARWQRT